MPALRAVFYGRMSDDKQENSIPEQKAWGQRAAAALGAEIVRSFQDDGEGRRRDKNGRDAGPREC
jgi:hypothetical protein